MNNNEMLAVTGCGLKSTGFKDEFYSWENENLDAPAFTPSGSTWAGDKMSNVVMPRHEMFWL
jgi:hypothetical protein